MLQRKASYVMLVLTVYDRPPSLLRKRSERIPIEHRLWSTTQLPSVSASPQVWVQQQQQQQQVSVRNWRSIEQRCCYRHFLRLFD